MSAAAPLRSLSVRGLSYRYPGTERGIAEIDLDLNRGDFIVVTDRDQLDELANAAFLRERQELVPAR